MTAREWSGLRMDAQMASVWDWIPMNGTWMLSMPDYNKILNSELSLS